MHFFLPLFFVLFFADLVSKLSAQYFLQNTNISLWGEFFTLQLSFNSGIAFSLPVPHWVQILFTLVFFVFFGWWARKYFFETSTLEQIGITFFIAGAFGNFWERVVYQHVTDFIALEFPPLYFPVFNIADICIFGGVVLWFWGSTQKSMSK